MNSEFRMIVKLKGIENYKYADLMREYIAWHPHTRIPPQLADDWRSARKSHHTKNTTNKLTEMAEAMRLKRGK